MKFRDELPIVGQFYLYGFLFWVAFGVMAGYWVLYFQDQGLSFTLIGLLFLANSLTMFIFEIPTGAIADTFGRKFSVALAYILLGFAFLGMILFSKNFIVLLSLHILTGIGYTLESGALESWFVDTVKHKKKEKHLHHFFGRSGSITNIGFIIGPFLGGLLVMYGYDKALLTNGIIILTLGILILFTGKEEYFKRKKVNITQDIRQTINNAKFGIKYVKENKTLLWLTANIFLMGIGVGLVYYAYQPYVISMGLNPSYIGYALSIAGIFLVLQLNYSQKITKFLGGNKSSLIIYGLIYTLVLFLIPSIKLLPLLFIILIAYTALYDMAGKTSPAFKEIQNKIIPSKHRASILSASAWIGALALVFTDLGFGILAGLFGPKMVLYLGGFLVLAGVLMYFKISKE
ncbi:MAG: MFS transporter [archaeon]